MYVEFAPNNTFLLPTAAYSRPLCMQYLELLTVGVLRCISYERVTTMVQVGIAVLDV